MNDITAMLFYEEEPTYLRFKEMCEDKDQFDRTHAEWKSGAQKFIDSVQRSGTTIRKINPDPDEFSLWCKIESRECDRLARQEFAIYKATKAKK